MGKEVYRVAVAGCGVVGSGVVKMLTQNADVVERAVGRPVKLAAIVDIRAVDAPSGVTVTSDIEQVLTVDPVDVLVETIGGQRIAYDYTRRALEKGVSVVTSNKELVAVRGEELTSLAREHGAWYLYEAAVGGGVPLLRPIKTCLAGNRLTGVDGIVNGSTNYLLTRMTNDSVSFSAALGEAKALGYAEADPAADVEGLDARRKLMILCSCLFQARLGADERIPTEGIARVTQEDIACCAAFGGAAKLIAHASLLDGGYTAWVHPAFVPREHPLYAVSDVFNGIVIHGDCVGDVMFYGRGAGAMPTASAIVGDLIEITRNIDRPVGHTGRDDAPSFVSPDAQETQAVLRIGAMGLRAARDMFPKAEIREVGACFALKTAPQPLGELLKKARFLRDADAGIPFIVLT